MEQLTIRKERTLKGVGLHTGKPVRLTFRPAPANTGIRFFRTDMSAPPIPARAQFVVDTRRGTTIELGPARVHTIEHALSACLGLGLDNVDILLDAPEPPAMDGSSLPFAEALLGAGLEPLRDAPRRYLRLDRPVKLSVGDASYTAEPAERSALMVVYEHAHPRLGRQAFEVSLEPERYLSEVAGARTFCLESEVAALRAAGLAQGGSLENCVVVGDKGIQASGGGLRFPDEFVRHKALDLLGDLALIGRSLEKVRITAVRTGHTLNVKFASLLNDAAQNLRRKK
jgi:UDP-3-O-acyl N-acetylglucosamine deacetylase